MVYLGSTWVYRSLKNGWIFPWQTVTVITRWQVDMQILRPLTRWNHGVMVIGLAAKQQRYEYDTARTITIVLYSSIYIYIYIYMVLHISMYVSMYFCTYISIYFYICLYIVLQVCSSTVIVLTILW